MTVDMLGRVGYLDVPMDVLGIARRVKEGDPTLNWRGDPDMELCFNPHLRRFEVIGIDAHGRPFVAAHAEGVTPKLLVDLAMNDWQHGPALLNRIYADIDKAEADRESAKRDKMAEVADKMLHAARKLVRQHGSGPRFFGQVGGA